MLASNMKLAGPRLAEGGKKRQKKGIEVSTKGLIELTVTQWIKRVLPAINNGQMA
jgi:hypothetical protein